jgi:uncharacterized membrane protein YphA (DoxX/SURF4 family)
MERLQNLDLSPMSAVGAALLRCILAGFWIVHWWFKVGYSGMPATEAFFLQHGLPAWLAWFDISFEVVIAACLILGIFVPLLCLISLPILFASMWIYRRNGFYFSSGRIELPVCGRVRKSPRSYSALALFGSHFRRGNSSRLYSGSRSDCEARSKGDARSSLSSLRGGRRRRFLQRL